MYNQYDIKKSLESFLEDCAHKLTTEEIERLNNICEKLSKANTEQQLLKLAVDVLKILGIWRDFL